MIEFKDFHHVSLSITDLERAKQFYGSILGFTELFIFPVLGIK